MRHTLKAVFDRRDARHVPDTLPACEYPRTDMAASGEDADSLGASIKRTFTRLIRSPHEQAMGRFNRFIRSGHVVTLATGSEPEAKSAPGIIERFRPVGSEDFMDAYRYGSEMRTKDKYRYCSWDEVEPFLKNDWQARATDTATWDGSRNAIRRGWSSTSPEIEDDRYFRAHWNAIYRNSVGEPEYDDRTPAYLYGSEARRSEKYRSHDWRDVEPDIEADWKARHAGQSSSWADFKDAVKHGWNRVRPEMDEKDGARESQHGSAGNDDRAAAGRPGTDSFEGKTS